MHETCLSFGILVHMKPMYTLGHCLPFLLHEMMTVHTPSVMRQGITAISDDFAYPVLLICLNQQGRRPALSSVQTHHPIRSRDLTRKTPKP